MVVVWVLVDLEQGGMGGEPFARGRSAAIRYAERRGIPFVCVPPDAGHQVRDIRSGEQVDADPATWVPPAEDLRPTIIRPTQTPAGSTT